MSESEMEADLKFLLDAAADEIKRLREALKAIVALKEDPSLTGDDIADDADAIARVALGEGKE